MRLRLGGVEDLSDGVSRGDVAMRKKVPGDVYARQQRGNWLTRLHFDFLSFKAPLYVLNAWSAHAFEVLAFNVGNTLPNFVSLLKQYEVESGSTFHVHLPCLDDVFIGELKAFLAWSGKSFWRIELWINKSNEWRFLKSALSSELFEEAQNCISIHDLSASDTAFEACGFKINHIAAQNSENSLGYLLEKNGKRWILCTHSKDYEFWSTPEAVSRSSYADALICGVQTKDDGSNIHKEAALTSFMALAYEARIRHMILDCTGMCFDESVLENTHDAIVKLAELYANQHPIESFYLPKVLIARDDSIFEV